MSVISQQDRDFLADIVRKKTTCPPADLDSAIHAVCEAIANCMNHYDNPLIKIERFSQGWIHRELRPEDRLLMQQNGESEVQYRARQYVTCYMSLLASQFDKSR